MTRYNTEFDPPAPLVDFTVYCPVDHGRTAGIQGELDSGDVLNQFIVTLDGKELNFETADP